MKKNSSIFKNKHPIRVVANIYIYTHPHKDQNGSKFEDDQNGKKFQDDQSDFKLKSKKR